MATNLLNQENIIRKVYDPPTQSLKVSGTSVIAPGQMEVAINAEDDNIAISDGTNTLAINADGSINVVVDSGPPPAPTIENAINKFNEVLAVASGATITLNSYTPPFGVIAYVKMVDVSGDNIAKYTVYLDGVKQDIKRTHFGSPLNASFDFRDVLKMQFGQVLTVEVLNFRPDVANFNARIGVLEVG